MIKYRRVTDLVPTISTLVVSQVQHNPSPAFENFLKTNPVIIPIPLHGQRKRERWFNQSELFARQLAKIWKRTVETGLLIRHKRTEPQAVLPKEARLKNVRGSFRIRTNGISRIPDSVLILDDVWTTGSTMREAGDVLKRAGVRKVWVFTIAR
ncbi:ComF family protein [Candidatus Roizmanbacteria bacterium]|nr:ComF family protein [Candidatus Roizmanbacteria bacterium]